VSEKYALIAAEQADHDDDVLAVATMCQALSVSRSGFYDWARAEPSARAVRRPRSASTSRRRSLSDAAPTGPAGSTLCWLAATTLRSRP
jgi:hypothetical protein